jgi:uncharacterized protein involved in response to NO
MTNPAEVTSAEAVGKAATGRKAVPRGIRLDGPPLLSYGFRPFFLGAGAFAALAMTIWVGALSEGWPIGGVYGPIFWHAHEMLFGYAAAAVTGFLLTSIPNWTGRLPVAGPPLLALFALWIAGRLAMLAPGFIGAVPAALVDCLFLPVVGALAAREIVAGRKWRDLKLIAIVAALSAANIAIHFMVLAGRDPLPALRFGLAIYIVLISLVGGRIIPSFTRNWLVKAGATRLPHPADRLDRCAIGATLLALLVWVIWPESLPTFGLALLAGLLQAFRLARWRGWATAREPLLLVLHLAYLFLPLGLLGVAAAALDWLDPTSALHILTVGGIGLTTLAVMTRATRGHTGRPLTASFLTTASYGAVLVAAVSRPLAEMVPQHYGVLLDVSGGAWIVAFLLFFGEYGPMLVTARLRSTPV